MKSSVPPLSPSPELAATTPDPFGPLRALIAEQTAGIDEAEAIAYARGFSRGLAVAGVTGERSQVLMIACGIEDKLLAAGCSWLGLEIAIAAVSEKH